MSRVADNNRGLEYVLVAATAGWCYSGMRVCGIMLYDILIHSSFLSPYTQRVLSTYS